MSNDLILTDGTRLPRPLAQRMVAADLEVAVEVIIADMQFNAAYRIHHQMNVVGVAMAQSSAQALAELEPLGPAGEPFKNAVLEANQHSAQVIYGIGQSRKEQVFAALPNKRGQIGGF